jgi:two-component system, sensor histidine kinase and response regulator
MTAGAPDGGASVVTGAAAAIPGRPPGRHVPDAMPADGHPAGNPSGHVDYRTLVEQIPCITYTEVHDTTTGKGQRTTFVSPQAARILGYAPAEFLADPDLWRKIRHPADRAKVLAAERTAEVTHQPFHAEYRMTARDGRMLWFRDDAVVVEDAESGGTFWQGVMFDISVEKHAAEQASEAELRYRSLVETLPATVFIDELDERATNIYTSPQTLQMFGYSPQEWRDVPDLWTRLIHPEDTDRIVASQARYKDAGETGVFDEEYRIVARDGHVVWVRDVAMVVRDDEGTPLYSQGFFLDITRQKEAEAELLDAVERERAQAERLVRLDALKNAVLSTLSKDLRAPLTAILAGANALRRPELDLAREETRDLLAQMATRARRMERLLNDLVDLDRLGRGILEPNRFPVDVAALVAEVVEGCEVLEGRRVEIDTEPVRIAADAPKVARIVENLLVNAAHHTPADASIWLRVRGAPEGALIEVADEGPGVPDGRKASLFDGLQRPYEVEGARGAGEGIGLALVARFAELHGGRAWVEDREGGGSSFRVLLPDATDPRSDATQPSAGSSSVSSGPAPDGTSTA